MSLFVFIRDDVVPVYRSLTIILTLQTQPIPGMCVIFGVAMKAVGC